MLRFTRLIAAVSAFVSLPFALCSHAADWPMWRFDANRSAASPENLPSELHLQWTHQYSQRVQVWDDPLNHDLMPYDKIFEPVVLGDRMFVGFNDADKVVALETTRGHELWTFYTDGPVRFPPVAWGDNVYFCSDDGYLYCVAAADGRLKWKFRGGPSGRKVLGNGRIISAWPARGGPVVRDGRVYFAASIWPFMGVFIYALNAEDGTVVWVNDSAGAQFIKQPHSAPAFAGVAPQGALVATKDILLVPGGRSVPAAFDRGTGELLYFHLNDGGKGNGGSFVAASESDFFVHTRMRGVRSYDLATGKATKITHGEPVIDGSVIYASSDDTERDLVLAVDTALDAPVEAESAENAGTNWGGKLLWELEVDASGDLIKAGQRLYAAGRRSLSAIEISGTGDHPRVVWSRATDGEVLRLIAAGGRLFAVTLDGRILAFGADKPDTITESHTTKVQGQQPNAANRALANSIVHAADAVDGYALWFGADDFELLDGLIVESSLNIVVVDPSSDRVDRLRRRFDSSGAYGNRLTANVGTADTFKAPPYVANLIGLGSSVVSQLDPPTLRTIYDSVRPYGGALWIPASGSSAAAMKQLVESARLERAVLRSGPGGLLVVRDGALPGADDWTHQYGDIANTVKSDDTRVKAPLGLLWFGGTSNMDVLPRHGHGPPEQVIGGRVFIQGMNSISGRDVYTGRLLWKTEFENLGTFGIYYNETYTNTPLSTAYNQKHIPGANGRGANYIATEDSIYVAVGSSCEVLDAKSGKLSRKIHLPARPGETKPPEWGFIGVYEDILFGGHGFAHYSQRFGTAEKKDPATIEDYSASAGLAAFDRHSGKLLWRVDARHSFIHNGIVAGNGRVYCLDKLPQSAEDKLKRRGAAAPAGYRIAAFDARTGIFLWETEQNIFGTWLSYSSERDVLLHAGAKASDRLRDEVGQGMTAYQGKSGQVIWQDLERSYTGPCIIHNDLILTGANSYQASSGAFNLLDGSPHLVRNPLTGKLEPWRISRAYGCNTMIASEHLLTFRSGAAGFYDLLSKSGTANLGGFKSGCTANLVVANGILNAPDYTRTCSCAYQNQTSLAFVHMPDIEMWTFSQFGMDAEEGDRIGRVGINFGAPGDRVSENGSLWLEYPAVASDSPGLEIAVAGEKVDFFRRHASQVLAGELPWVAASGIRDCDSVIIVPEIIPGNIRKPSKDDNYPENRMLTADELAATVVPPRHPPAPYTVRLHFMEPDHSQPGQRVFGVSLQGKKVMEALDIVTAAGGPYRSLVREFNGVIIERELRIEFRRAPDSIAGPILCGVELIAETDAAVEPPTEGLPTKHTN